MQEIWWIFLNFVPLHPEKTEELIFLDRSARRRKETLATAGTQEQKNITKEQKNMYLCSYVKKKKMLVCYYVFKK